MPDFECDENICYEPTQCNATTLLMEEVCRARSQGPQDNPPSKKGESNHVDLPSMGNFMDTVKGTFSDIGKVIASLIELSESKTTEDVLRNFMKGYSLLDHNMQISTSMLKPLLRMISNDASTDMLLQGVTNIEKHGDRITLKRSGKLTFPIGKELGLGFTLDSIDLGSIGFDVGGDQSNPKLKHISGVTIQVSDALGEVQSIPVQEIALKALGNGDLEIDVQVKNPAPMVLREDRPGSIRIALTLKKDKRLTWSGSPLDLL